MVPGGPALWVVDGFGARLQWLAPAALGSYGATRRALTAGVLDE